MEVLVLALIAMTVVALVGLRGDETSRDAAQARDPGLAELGARLGLEVFGERLLGQVEGARVAVHRPDTLAAPTVWVVVVDLPFSLPPGVGAHLERRASGAVLEPSVEVKDLGWLLSGPAVRTAVTRLAELGCQVEIGRDVLVRADVAVLQPAVEAGAALVNALVDRRSGPVFELAERMSVEIGDPLRLERLEGTVGGVDLVVGLPWLEDDRWRTRVRGRWRRELPQVEIVCRGRGRGASKELGDVILDTVLHVRTPEPEAVRSRLARDHVRGRLLDIVCGHPGSSIDAKGVTLVVDEGAFVLDALVDEVVELVRAVDAR